MRATSLRSELTRASMITTVIALLLCAAALLTYEYTTYRKVWLNDLGAQADLIARTSVAALEFDDQKAATENLSLFRLQPRVVDAAIFDSTPKQFARYPDNAATKGVPLELDAALVAAKSRFRGSLVEVAYPIERGGQRVGMVYLSARHDVAQRLASYGAIVLTVIALSAGVAFFIFNRLQDAVVRPLGEITGVAREVIRTRNWKLRAGSTRYTDVSLLAEAFNGMLVEVQERTTELELEMTERTRAERELKEADRKKDEFLAVLAHELRNPLAAMKMATVLLARSAASPQKSVRAVEIIDSQLEHMVRYINDLLDVSRIKTGKLSLQLEPVDLAAIVATSVESALSTAQDKHLDLQFHFGVSSVPLLGDASRLAQIMSNLIGNACRYTPAGGKVEVSISRHSQSVEVSVKDSGVGISIEMQTKVFELFEQGDKSLERGNAGLGIGLTLARQLANLHGGDILVASAGAGCGSTFTLQLPISEAVQQLEARDGLAALTPRVKDIRVLIADDNIDLASGLAELLEAEGCSVQVVHDGEAALSAAHTFLPHVALLDIGMPKLNGYEVARQLKRNPATSEICLFAISGWGQNSDIAMALEAGFQSHFVKPVPMTPLLAAIADSTLEAATGP